MRATSAGPIIYSHREPPKPITVDDQVKPRFGNDIIGVVVGIVDAKTVLVRWPDTNGPSESMIEFLSVIRK